jgi:RES domain-containing protein
LRHAFRIVKRRHAQHAFNGEGARLAGGRWNSPDLRAVYLSSTLSLAAMETFVHLGEDAARLDYVYFEIDIPAAVLLIEPLRVKPKGWRNEPPMSQSMRVGDRWLRAATSALLEVPSAIIPTETNLILNPAHPDRAKLRIGAARPFHFDPRMWK